MWLDLWVCFFYSFFFEGEENYGMGYEEIGCERNEEHSLCQAFNDDVFPLWDIFNVFK